jgi:hypothetical protein
MAALLSFPSFSVVVFLFMYLILYIFRKVALHILFYYYQPLHNNSFLFLHFSANHRRHHQGIIFHRHAQRTVCQWMVICTFIICSSRSRWLAETCRSKDNYCAVVGNNKNLYVFFFL